MVEKSNLYNGKPIPFDQLSPDGWEDFAYQVLGEIGKKRGFHTLSGRQNSSDEGFDVTARRNSDNALICIQCKRYASSIGLPTLASELVKVGLNTLLEGSTVKDHYLISSGKVTIDLRKKLRKSSREDIKKSALDKLAHADFATLRDKCYKEGVSAEETINSYIDNLDEIYVWSNVDFDNELTNVWSNIQDVLEKNFSLMVAVREYPRPDFDFDVLTTKILAKKPLVVPLFVSADASLPHNLLNVSASDGISNTPLNTSGLKGRFDVNQVLSNILDNESVVILGAGGAGKSTIFENFENLLIEAQADEVSIIPVYIRASSYKGDLDELIHRRLGITHGHWKSLPNNLFLLIDGIDEITDLKTQVLFDEISEISTNKIKLALSLRETGLRNPAYLGSIRYCFTLHNLSYRDCEKISESLIPSDEIGEFLKCFRGKVRTFGSQILALPFGFKVAVDYFNQEKTLPKNFDDLLENIVNKKIISNKARVHSADISINSVSENTIRELSSAVAFEFRIIRKNAAVPQYEAEKIVMSALRQIKEAEVFGADDIGDNKAFALALHYEIVKHGSDDMFYIDHDIIADYQASNILAVDWEHRLNDISIVLGADSWVFASRKISTGKILKFIDKVLSIDLILAARCAYSVGGSTFKNVETSIFNADNSNSPLQVSKAATAMAILKSENCMRRLKSNARSVDNHKAFQAQRALALAGDKVFLEDCLSQNESGVAAGLNPSGGNYDMWFIGPPFILTDISRERIKLSIGKDNIFSSMAIDTISTFGDKTDIEDVSIVLRETVNPKEFYSACRCLLNLDRNHAVSVITSIAYSTKQSNSSLYAINFLSESGNEVDVSSIFSQFIDHAGATHTQQISNVEIFIKLLGKNSLPENASQLLESCLDVSSDTKNYNVWSIATEHGFENFHNLAWLFLMGDSESKLSVGITFGRINFLSNGDKSKFINLLSSQLERKIQFITNFGFSVWRIIEALIFLGENEYCAGKLSDIIREHISIYFQKRTDENVEVWSFYAMDFPCLIIEAEKIKHYLEEEVIVLLVGMDSVFTQQGFREAHASLLQTLPADILDDHIDKIQDKDIKINTLGAIVHFGATKRRAEMVLDMLPTALAHHMHNLDLVGFISYCWDDTFIEAFITSVANYSWDNISAQLFNSVSNAVVGKITADQSQRYISPIIDTIHNSEALYLLRLWHDVANESKDTDIG